MFGVEIDWYRCVFVDMSCSFKYLIDLQIPPSSAKYNDPEKWN